MKLNADIEEVKKFLSQSARARVKQFLEIQQRRLETDLILLKEKQEQQTPATEKKPTAPVTSSNRVYTKEITLYGKTKQILNDIHIENENKFFSSLGSIG